MILILETSRGSVCENLKGSQSVGAAGPSLIVLLKIKSMLLVKGFLFWC